MDLPNGKSHHENLPISNGRFYNIVQNDEKTCLYQWEAVWAIAK